MKHLGKRLRSYLALPGLAVIALAAVIATLSSDTRAGPTPAYSIDFHTISSGGSSLRNSCYHLTGTLGQAAPGYSSAGTLYETAGFWAAAPTAGLDDIFFNGFQGC